jgi:hypothetical protein
MGTPAIDEVYGKLVVLAEDAAFTAIPPECSNPSRQGLGHASSHPSIDPTAPGSDQQRVARSLVLATGTRSRQNLAPASDLMEVLP